MTLHPEAQKLADHLFHLDSKWDSGVEEFLEEAIADFAENHPHDPAGDIVPGWGVQDVDHVIKERWGEEFRISRDDAIAVLERAQNEFDANNGISWDHLSDCIHNLRVEGAVVLIEGEEVDDGED